MSTPSVLPPLRQADLFICDVLDAMPKDDMASMSHPIFSLSTRPDREARVYRRGDVEVRVIPSILGLATIHDKDILIYCISQLMAGIRAGRQVSRSLSLVVHDLLIATDRTVGGAGYARIGDALGRLSGTRLETTIAAGDVVSQSGFGLVDEWYVERETRDGRMISLRVTLSEWLFRAVMASEVLTISRDYFRLRKPLERRLYELCRRHCGSQSRWQIGLDKLQAKCGAAGTSRRFRSSIRQAISDDRLPDYTLTMRDDVLTCRPRQVAQAVAIRRGPVLRPGTYDLARAAAPGYDIYALEAEWRSWWSASGEPVFRSPDGAFVGFCRARYARNPEP